MFIYSEQDMTLVNVDEIAYVRCLDESDLDPRDGQLRSGIPKNAVTELRLKNYAGTLYLQEPIEDFVVRLRSALDVLEARA